MHEKKDRVDDALHATKAALEEGIIAGGGIALLYSNETPLTLENGNPDFNYGLKIVQKACQKPFEQILTNAGQTETEAQILSHQLKDKKDSWMGYNIKKDKITNMKKILSLLCLSTITFFSYSQKDQVLMTVNGQPVYKTEFDKSLKP